MCRLFGRKSVRIDRPKRVDSLQPREVLVYVGFGLHGVSRRRLRFGVVVDKLRALPGRQIQVRDWLYRLLFVCGREVLECYCCYDFVCLCKLQCRDLLDQHGLIELRSVPRRFSSVDLGLRSLRPLSERLVLRLDGPFRSY